MKRSTRGTVLALVAGLAMVCSASFAEVTVSISISGSPDDLAPILQHLKDMGVTFGKGAPAPGEAIKMQVQSAPAAPAAAAPAPKAPAAPTVSAPVATPATPKAGTKTVITVAITDADHRVDSVAVNIPELSKTFDLYDNGTHGDKTIRDGTWSSEIEIPATASGDLNLVVKVFNANGEPVQGPGKDGVMAPITAQGKISVTK